MRLFRRFFPSLVVVAVSLGSVAGAAASAENESFGIAPFPEQVNGLDRLTFGIPLEPGATFEDAVRVYNRTDQPIDLAIYPADARAPVDGAISIGFRGSRPEGVGAWIELTRDEVSLPARAESIVRFRITVQSATPSPDIGAIVVENTARGLRADLAQRLHVVVRTVPPSSPTTSERVRPLFLRSPWLVVAVLGLLVAASLVWLGARRARRPADALPPADGKLTKPDEDKVPAASKPILHRLGAEVRQVGRKKPARASGAERVRSPSRHDDVTEVITKVANDTPDERPLLDLFPDEEETSSEPEPDVPAPEEPEAPDELEAELEPPPSPLERTRAKQSAKKLDYIPLDDL